MALVVEHILANKFKVVEYILAKFRLSGTYCNDHYSYRFGIYCNDHSYSCKIYCNNLSYSCEIYCNIILIVSCRNR